MRLIIPTPGRDYLGDTTDERNFGEVVLVDVGEQVAGEPGNMGALAVTWASFVGYSHPAEWEEDFKSEVEKTSLDLDLLSRLSVDTYPSHNQIF